MSPREEPGPPGQILFSQGLGLWRAMAPAVGVMTTAAAFVLMGDAAAAGSLAPLAFLLAALLVVLNGLGYAELAVGSSRSGGAYSIVYRRTGDEGHAFLTGWVLALSSLGFCALLTQGAGRYLAQLLSVLSGGRVSPNLLSTGLLLLVVLGECLGRRARWRPNFTLLMLILLAFLAVWAVARGQAVRPSALTQRHLAPAISGLVVTFVALELITGYQREIRRQAVNLPRALLIAPVAVAALGAAIASVITSALGGWPSMASEVYVMSRDGFWPAWLRHTPPGGGRPIRLVLLVGLLLLPMAWIPAGLLSRTSGLTYLLTLMAVNLALARRPRLASPAEGEKDRPPASKRKPRFRLPFHPWVPALTLAVDVLVIPLWGLAPVAWGAGCLAVGVFVYLAYGRGRYIEAQEGVTVFRSLDEERPPVPFRVLVPIANPATAGALLQLAGKLAQAQGGEVLALQVVVVPEPMPLEAGRRRARAGQVLFEQALALANQEKLPVRTMTRVARTIAQGILDTAAEARVDLIVTGRRGPVRSRETSLGPIVDAVLRDAPCDVLVMQGQDGGLPRRVLVPTSGGPHARVAARLALSLAEACQATVTLLCVHTGPETPQQIERCRCRIAETLDGLRSPYVPEKKLVTATSVVEGIVQEARRYDLVLLGVSEESLLDRLVFGSVPLQVAARVPETALVQGRRGVTGVWTRRIILTMRDILPVLSDEEQATVRRELAQGARPGINYFVLIVLSCIIAALGLLQDSPTVVIGAMLVAPLWAPILAFSLGLVQGDLRLIRFSTEGIFKGVALAVVIAAFIGLISPLKTITGQILTYAQPTLLDLAVALVAGLAGAYAMARKDVSAALPGVAIAATLMPPLATVGLGLSLGDARVAGGALLLFATNIAAISLAGGIVFLLLGIRPQAWGPESLRQLRRRFAASLSLLVVIAVPLGIMMASTLRDAAEQRTVEAVLVERLADRDSHLVALEIERGRTGLLVVATVRSTQPFGTEAVDDLAEALSEKLGRQVQLEMVIMPALRSEGE